MKLSKTLIVLDLETTGTWVEKDKIVEIGMVRLTPEGKRDVYVQRVNPGIPIPPEVSELIGITNDDIANEPYFREVATQVLDFIGDSDIAGFNVERFDLPLIEREFYHAGFKFEWQRLTIYDAQKIYHLNEKRDLTAAYKFYCEKDLVNAHSALADAEATAEILAAQVEKYGMGNEKIESVGKFNYRNSFDYLDPDRKFRWWNGEAYPLFGKYAKKLSLREMARKDPEYMQWILSKDFSDEVKDLVEKAMRGVFPVFVEKTTKTT